jgi:hypothetical protein
VSSMGRAVRLLASASRAVRLAEGVVKPLVVVTVVLALRRALMG